MIGTFPGYLGGAGQFDVSQYVPTSNDDCLLPVAISGPGNFPFDNSAATSGTAGQNEAACYFFGNTAVQGDVWFDWTSTWTGTAQMTTVGLTAVDTKIAVYPGPGCPAAPWPRAPEHRDRAGPRSSPPRCR